jgi:transposase-like protein
MVGIGARKVIQFFAFCAPVHRMTYTTNAIMVLTEH